MEDIWTLQRSTTDGKLAGVCSAVATRYGIDPLLVRIVAVLLALSAGVGLALYVAAWALLPSDADPVPIAHRAVPALAQWSRNTMTALLGAWVVAVVVVAGQFFTIGLGPVLIVAALWWFGVIKPRRAVTSRTSPAVGPPTTEQAFVHEAAAWRARVDAHLVGIDWRDAAAAPERVTAPSWQPAPWTPYEAAPAADGIAPLTAPPAPPLRTSPPLSEAALVRARRRRQVGAVTFAAVAIVCAAMVAAGAQSIATFAACALLVVGGGLVASTWTGRPKGLLVAAIVLLVVTIGSVGRPTADPAVSYAPVHAADLPSAISISAGEVTIDLTRMTEPAERTVHVQVGAGAVRVLVPRESNAVVQATLGMGSFSAPGLVEEGRVKATYRQTPDPAAPTLTLVIDVTVGELVVEES